MKINKATNNVDRLISKFKRLNGRGVVIAVLDDLDRLRPNEIVDILRMVEKIRLLPNVIVILPVFKSVVSKAIATDLSLDISGAYRFLRKLTDDGMYVDNSVNDLRLLFQSILTPQITQNLKNKTSWGIGEYKMNVDIALLIWCIVLHILILSEVSNLIESYKTKTVQLERSEVMSPSVSSYLCSLNDLLRNNKYENNMSDKDFSGLEPYPVFHRGKIIPIGDKFSSIHNDRNNSWQQGIVSLLNNPENLGSVVTTNLGVLGKLRENGSPSLTFGSDDKKIEDSAKIPIFIAVMLPILEKSSSEKFLTNNYKRRDIDIIARKLSQKLNKFEYSLREEDSIINLFNIVKDSVDTF